MVGIFTRVERLNTIPPRVVDVVAATSTEVLPDRRSEGTTMVYRFIQNLTANPAYFAIDVDCDGVHMIHGLLQEGVQLSIPSMSRVTVWSAAGTQIATVEFERVNL